jgi:uncharacterized membrane protein YhaH (DUF805 family)
MGYAWYLFRFEGRLNRARFWVAGLMMIGGALFLSMVLLAVAKLLGNTTPLWFCFDGSDVFRIVDPTWLRVAIGEFRNADLGSTATLLPLLFRLVVTPVVVWCCAAVSIKRLHDRNRSGWWMVPFFVAPGLYHQFDDRLGDSYALAIIGLAVFVVSVWGYVELCFLRGTRGPNGFGPDPLAPVDLRPRWDQQSELEFVPHRAGPPAGTHGIRGHD